MSFQFKIITGQRSRLLILVAGVFFQSAVNAQYVNFGARAAGFGNASVGMYDANSVITNQAGMAFMNTLAVVAYAEQRYLIPELRNFGIGAVLPVPSGTFGLTLNQFGFEEFKQQKVGVSYSRKLFENFSVGAQFDYFQTRISEYGNKGTLTFEAGMLVFISKKLTAGTHIFSPARVEIAEGEELPTTYRIGLGYFPSAKVTMAFEMQKEIDAPTQLKAGLEYWPIKPLCLRVGVNTKPDKVAFGFGFFIKHGIKLDVAASYHQVLGFSPVAGISWELEK
jgi:hypothetical protein